MEGGAPLSSFAAVLDGADVARWIDVDVPELGFAIAGLIPDRCVSLLAGDGGSGKSILLQTAATCVAMGLPFLGREVTQGPALYVTGEDPEAVIHGRQARINKALGLEMGDLAGKLFVMSASEQEFILFSSEETQLLRKLTMDMTLRGIRFAGIDSATLTFDNDEINRRAVSAFLRSLNTMARRTRAAVVLIAHTSRSSDGTSARMASGSTAWVNSARAGLLLKGLEDGAELTLLKANYAKSGIKIGLRWTGEGVLVSDEPETGTVASIEKSADDALVLNEIAAAWRDPGAAPLSRAPQTQARYLPSFMARQHGWKAKRTEAATARLFDAGKISSGEVRKNGKRHTGLCPISDEK